MIVDQSEGAGTDRVALYDSVTGWAFGPVFPDVETARTFLDWLPEDARVYSTATLAEMYGVFAHRDVCPRCGGRGEIHVNPGYPDPQTAEYVECGDCEGSGTRPEQVQA
jgi:hypothetical protein